MSRVTKNSGIRNALSKNFKCCNCSTEDVNSIMLWSKRKLSEDLEVVDIFDNSTILKLFLPPLITINY